MMGWETLHMTHLGGPIPLHLAGVHGHAAVAEQSEGGERGHVVLLDVTTCHVSNSRMAGLGKMLLKCI